MILPNKDEFLAEIEHIEDDKIKNHIIYLYDYVTSADKNDKNFNIHVLLKELLNELFNPFGYLQEIVIPYNFFETTIGKLVISVLSKSNDVYYTIADLTAMSITPEKPKGLTKQYLSQEIKENRLKAHKESGIWMISALEAERYLKSKNIIK